MNAISRESMDKKLRRTGIDPIGELQWGTHFCQFYETKQDLLDVLVPYFRAGLEDNEMCLWVVSAPLTKAEALASFRQGVAEADRHLADGDIEFLSHKSFYFREGSFDSSPVIDTWRTKLAQAMKRGYAGLRMHGDEAWLRDQDWEDFLAYEHKINEEFANERVLILCTYPLQRRKGNEVFEVAHAHQLVLARRNGLWDSLESPELKKTKAELAALAKKLDSRVQRQTTELKLADESLRAEVVERRRTEKEIKERDNELHTLLQNVPAGVLKTDREGLIEYFNPVARELWGRTPAIHDPKDRYCGSFRIFGTDGIPLSIEDNPVARVLRSGSAIRDAELIMERPDGEKLNVLVNVAPIKDEYGHVMGAVSCTLDISALKRAEEELHAREQEVRTIVENTPDAIVRYDRNLRRIYANRAIIRVSGLSKETVLNGPAGSLAKDAGVSVETDYSQVIRDSIKAVFDSGKAREFEINWPAPIGLRTFNVRMTPEFDTQGTIVSVLAVGRDITNLQQAERALREAQTELARVERVTTMGELAASIAHEVNQPLAAVVTDANAASYWLAAVPANLDEARESIRRIVRNGNRASEVIARIRGLLKRTEPSKRATDINELIEESIALLQQEFARNRISVQTNLTRKLPVTFADRVQVQQVVINLLVNALESLKAVADRPRMLSIRSEPFEPGTIRVAVQDNGIGIDLEQADRLFQAFFTTKAHGLGMGLAISRSIIESHGGRLWATVNMGPGVTFQFTLLIQNEAPL